MRLSHLEPQGIWGEGKKRLNDCLQQQCRTPNCSSDSASVVRRCNAAGLISVVVQCDECGVQIAAVKKNFVPRVMDLGHWRDDVPQAWLASYYEKIGRYDAVDRRGSGKAEYHAWLESPDWKNIRSKVLNRAAYKCEACLAAKASQVHHVTYNYGWLAPAWALKAVCVHCHLRLHEDHAVQAVIASFEDRGA